MEEIVSNLYRAEIPLPKSPLKWLNSYIIRGGDRFLIIDTGFNREECLNEMNASLQKLGVDLNRTDFFITHLHADHMGLVGTLAKDSAKVYFNEKEAKRANSAHDNEYWQRILNVYVANGFAAEDARISLERHPGRKFRSKRKIEFTFVEEGDRIEIGDYRFKCIATPGHSPGHTVLYEEDHKILIVGDHVLFDITPNITYWLNMEDALEQYLISLEKVKALDVKLVLTGHRRIVHDLHGRVEELQEHHRTRLHEVLTALSDGEKNILQIAPHITWDLDARTWEAFPPQQKWFAFGETLAHVRYLEDKGKVQRRSQKGMIKYALS